jgi:hypothetical protein
VKTIRSSNFWSRSAGARTGNATRTRCSREETLAPVQNNNNVCAERKSGKSFPIASNKSVRDRGDFSTNLSKAECVHALKGLALPRASHSSEIALVGSRRLRS